MNVKDKLYSELYWTVGNLFMFWLLIILLLGLATLMCVWYGYHLAVFASPFVIVPIKHMILLRKCYIEMYVKK